MKISNNALNFLLAQYRAIFKRAYVKGIASAVLLTAGLAAGQAQAAATHFTTLDAINAEEDNVVDFDGTTNRLALKVDNTTNATNVLDRDLNIELDGTSDKLNQYIAGSGTAATGDDNNSILDGNDKNITITGSNEDGANEFYFGLGEGEPKLQIKDLGTLTINGAKVSLVTQASDKNTSGNQVGVDVGAAKVVIENGAVVNLSNNLDPKNNGNKANTLLRGTVMEVTGAETVVNIGNSTLTGAKDAKNTKAVFGYEEARDSQDNVTTKGSAITVTDATLNLYGAVVGQNKDAKNQVLGGTKGYAALIQGKTLNMNNASLNVKANGTLSGENGNYGGAGGILAVHKSTLTNSYLTIEDQATFNLQMREFAKDYDGTAYEDNNNSRDYNGSLTIDGGVVVIDGVLRHTKGGLLEIKDGTQLTGGAKMADLTAADAATKNENKLDNAIFIGVYGDAANPNINDTESSGIYSGSFGNSTLSALRLSSNTLDQFLNSDEEQITAKDGTTQIKDYKGQLVVHHGAHIEFTDQQQVEMSKFTFDNNAGAGHISTTITASSGIIDGKQAQIGNTKDESAVDGTRTIMAQNMSIGKTLISTTEDTGTTDAEHVTSGNSSFAFRFEANDMVLGSEKGTLNDDTNWNGFDSKDQIGAHEIKAHKSITFIDGRSDTFYLQDDVVLDTTLGSDTVLGSADSSNTGTLKGDDVVIGYDNGTSSTSGSLKVAGGAWSTTQGQSIKVADGSLTVSAQAGTKKEDGLDLDGTNNASYYAGGVNTSLVINGGSFVIDKSEHATNAPSVTVTGASGATALLDLRGTSVTWGSGSVTITGAAERDSKTDILSDAGEGQVFITGAQFKDFIDTERAQNPSETKITLGDDGVLFADGTISGDIKVGTFVTNAAAAGKVYFSGAGTFATNGQLSIAADAASDVLAIGAGTISAQSLTLTNKGIEAKDKGDLDNDIFTVSGGTLEVTNGLSSSNSIVEFKADGSSNAGKLILDTDDNTASGLINTNLRFSADTTTAKSYALEVEQGQWAMAEGKDAYFASGANFKVGADTEEFELQGATASLSLDNLNVTGTSSNLVDEGGNLTVNTMQAGEKATFEVQGQFTINGRSDIGSGSASTEIDEVKKADDTAGIDLAGAQFDVYGPKAQLKLGNVATETLVQITAAQLEGTAKTTVKVDKAIDDAIINLKDHGMLYLDFDSGTTITAQNAKDLKAALITSMGNGILNVGSGSLDIKWDHEDTLTTSWDSVKEFANVRGVTSDKLMSTLIDEVAVGTVITGGQYGAIQTDFAAPTALQVDGNLGLHQARGENGGYFVFSTNAAGEQSAVGVDLAADATLLLDGAGKIGAIGGTTGTELVITQGMHSGAAVGTTEILGAIRGVESVEVGNDTTVAGNIDAGELRLEAGTNLTNVFAGTAAYDTVVTTADVFANASFSTQNFTLDARNGRATGYNDSWIMGSVEVGDTLKLQSNQVGALVDADGNAVHANELIIAGGTVKAQTRS